MTNETLKCPKCLCSKLILTEVAELETSYIYENGGFASSKIENVSDILRHEAYCTNERCKHKWILQDVRFNDIPIHTAKPKIIEFNCITCGMMKKVSLHSNSTFDPKTDECYECQLGITEIPKK